VSPAAAWSLACPECRTPLGALDAGEAPLVCRVCGNAYRSEDAIRRFLTPERERFLEPFLRDYTRIRLAEGRGSESPDFYLRLPECDPAHPIAWQWAIRRRTFDHLVRRVLPRLGPKRQIVDLGAGVGWLSRHLAELGHSVCAIDVSVDAQDGLGAARHYAPAWPRFQAEFDRLPLDRASADVVLYNASLHYSTDYATTLREALRVLRPGGWIVVLESPIYRKEASGRQMVAERHAAFEKRYGTRSDSIPSLEYLTWDRLEGLGRELGLKWQRFTPWYGWRWAMRPWQARLKRNREPSRFVILLAAAP
jgi:SAM-dependent methyltransferase